MSQRKRRKFTPEQKATTIEMVKTSGQPIAPMARELDLSESALRKWIQQAQIDSKQDLQGDLTRAP